MSYYILKDNEANGPHTLGQLKAMWNSGTITGETLHSQEGYSEWLPVNTIIDKLETSPVPPLIPAPPSQQFYQTPPRQKKQSIWILGALLLILLGFFVIVGALIAVAALTTKDTVTSTAPIDLEAFIAKYGPPDKEESTAYDTPRPPIVTRFLIYQPERVRAVYFPDGKVGEPPPYRRWKLLGFQDSEDDHVLKPSEVDEKLKNRKRR